MKNSIALLVCSAIFFAGCLQKKTQEVDKFYMERFEDGSFRDSDTLLRLYAHHADDALIKCFSFYYRNAGHQVRIYSNEHIAPIDGEYTIYELDDFGGIMGQSHTWNSYTRAHSTNDSIEALFSVAIDQCLTRIRTKPLINHYDRTRSVTFETPEAP